jgi:hypothetical protein
MVAVRTDYRRRPSKNEFDDQRKSLENQQNTMAAVAVEGVTLRGLRT